MLRGALLLALLPGAALAQSGQHGLGEEWVGADGNRRVAKIGVQFDRPPTADPALARKITLNWRDFPYQKGDFPIAIGDQDIFDTVGATVTVDATGVPTGCKVTRASETVAFDAHACPHVQRHVRFHPALTLDGTRAGGTLKLRVVYSAGRIRALSGGFGIAPPISQSKAKPVKPIDAAMIGFSRSDGLPAYVHGVSGWLRVEDDGSVSACSLDSPTMDDKFDLSVCARLRGWPFQPALDRTGRPVASDYGFGVSRSR